MANKDKLKKRVATRLGEAQSILAGASKKLSKVNPKASASIKKSAAGIGVARKNTKKTPSENFKSQMVTDDGFHPGSKGGAINRTKGVKGGKAKRAAKKLAANTPRERDGDFKEVRAPKAKDTPTATSPVRVRAKKDLGNPSGPLNSIVDGVVKGFNKWKSGPLANGVQKVGAMLQANADKHMPNATLANAPARAKKGFNKARPVVEKIGLTVAAAAHKAGKDVMSHYEGKAKAIKSKNDEKRLTNFESKPGAASTKKKSAPKKSTTEVKTASANDKKNKPSIVSGGKQARPAPMGKPPEAPKYVSDNPNVGSPPPARKPMNANGLGDKSTKFDNTQQIASPDSDSFDHLAAQMNKKKK